MEPIVIAGLITLVCIALGVAASRHDSSSEPRIVAKGDLLVVDEGSIVINEPLPEVHGLLDDPERYIVIEFDPNQPAPPPCAGDDADELDWELTFTHRHDTHVEPKNNVDLLRLKIMWRVSTARTIVWRMLKPSKKEH